MTVPPTLKSDCEVSHREKFIEVDLDTEVSCLPFGEIRTLETFFPYVVTEDCGSFLFHVFQLI